MINATVTYAIFGGLFVAGIALGYFASQQQVSELRSQMVDIVNRIAEGNAQIQSLQNDIGQLEREVAYYKTPIILEYTKTGGIAGINQYLKIDEFGNLIASSTGIEQQSKLSQQSITKIKDILIENDFFDIYPIVYNAAPGNADFFAYSLTVTMADLRKQIIWVDSWASEDELPEELLSIQAELAALYDSAVIPVNANTEIGNGLKLTLKADKVEYSSKDVVHITAMLENIGPHTVAYTSPTPCDSNIQIIVKSESNMYDITYANREPIPCIQVLQSRELLPGSLIVQEVEWDQELTIDDVKTQVSADVYTIEARFPLANFEETLVKSSIAIQIKD